MSHPLRVLLVEDAEDDAALLMRELCRGGYAPQMARVETAAAMRAALAQPGWDVVISDYVLPQFGAPEALALLREAGLDLPFIIVSGRIGEETAVAAMRAGAHDYVMKGNLARLVPAIRREMQEAAIRREHRRAGELSARLGRILDNSPNEIYVFDATTLRFIQVNRGACLNLGYSMAELARMTPLDLKAEMSSAQFAGLIQPLRSGKQDQVVFETTHQRKDGSTYPVEARLHLSRSETPPVFVAITRDISERLRIEAELREANSAKDRFLAVLSHELRNPLTAIQASVEVLRRSAGDDPRLGRAVDALVRNVRTQTRLVSDLLELSRVVCGKVQIVPRPLRLDLLAAAVAEQLRPRAEETGLALDVAHLQPVWVCGDPERLDQVVSNLLDNAIKFTPRGGQVSLSVVRARGGARLTVEDSGVGLDPALSGHLFEMFAQGSAAGARRPGLGIGLALVRQLVELHGGRVAAWSAGPGRGSRFTVQLPAVPAPPRAQSQETGGGAAGQLRVLLVDDSADQLNMLAEILRMEGWEITPARSAEEALDCLGGQPPPDVIVSDLSLPGMDGRELLRRVRRTPGLAQVPAFALSGFGEESDVEASKAAGFTDHLVKGIEVDELIRRIRAAPRCTAL